MWSSTLYVNILKWNTATCTYNIVENRLKFPYFVPGEEWRTIYFFRSKAILYCLSNRQRHKAKAKQKFLHT